MAADIPRLEFEQFEPALAAALAPRMTRLGYVGEFFKCTAHQPDALRAFMDFTAASKKNLPDKLVEIIALTVAVETGNDYERNQHERLSVRLGFGRDWVTAAERLDADGAGLLSADERAVQRYVLAALEHGGKGAADELAAVVERLGPAAAVAVMMVLGRYVTHTVIVNSLRLAPPVPSIFEDGFDG